MVSKNKMKNTTRENLKKEKVINLDIKISQIKIWWNEDYKRA